MSEPSCATCASLGVGGDRLRKDADPAWAYGGEPVAKEWPGVRAP